MISAAVIVSYKVDSESVHSQSFDTASIVLDTPVLVMEIGHFTWTNARYISTILLLEQGLVV